jgi:hypothetical protein
MLAHGLRTTHWSQKPRQGCSTEEPPQLFSRLRCACSTLEKSGAVKGSRWTQSNRLADSGHSLKGLSQEYEFYSTCDEKALRSFEECRSMVKSHDMEEELE